MTGTAFLFPGQGSQRAGMGKEAAAAFPEASAVYREADAALGFPLSRLCFEGPDTELALTENTQPAILATSVALARVLLGRGVEPDYVAGHSLGEYSALVAAGAIALPEALDLVRKRGRYMQEAVPIGEGAMAALLGLSPEQVLDICREAAGDQVVEPANYNGAGQIVIAGHAPAVERAAALARERGARRVIPLAVSAPFHSSLMKPAAERLAPDLGAVTMSDPRPPVVSNVDAAPVATAEEVRRALLRQVASPVRWEESIEWLSRAGVTRFVEVGPGRVLSGLVRKMNRNARVLSVEGPAGIEEVLGA